MPHGTTIRTNGQTLTVNASVSHWTTEALALTASGTNDVESTTTTTITSDYTLWFANTATTATITVKQLDGTTLLSQTFEVNPGVGPRTLNPIPNEYQSASDLRRRLTLAPSGALAETYPRVGAITGNNALTTTGVLYMTAIELEAGVTVRTATYVTATTAGGTLTNQWYALYNSSRVLLGQTADDTSTAWAANTAKTLTFATPIVTTYSGLHYLGIMVAAGTVPTFVSGGTSIYMSGITPVTNGTSTTGLTDTAPSTAASINVASVVPYAYIS